MAVHVIALYTFKIITVHVIYTNKSLWPYFSFILQSCSAIYHWQLFDSIYQLLSPIYQSFQSINQSLVLHRVSIVYDIDITERYRSTIIGHRNCRSTENAASHEAKFRQIASDTKAQLSIRGHLLFPSKIQLQIFLGMNLIRLSYAVVVVVIISIIRTERLVVETEVWISWL